MSMMMIIFIVATLVFVAFFFYMGTQTSKSHKRPDANDPRTTEYALKILEERYAKGEIDESEYVRRKTVLTR